MLTANGKARRRAPQAGAERRMVSSCPAFWAWSPSQEEGRQDAFCSEMKDLVSLVRSQVNSWSCRDCKPREAARPRQSTPDPHRTGVGGTARGSDSPGHSREQSRGLLRHYAHTDRPQTKR